MGKNVNPIINSVMNLKDVKAMLKEFGVKTEDELLKKLDMESRNIACSICGSSFPVEQMHYVGGDPICPKCWMS